MSLFFVPQSWDKNEDTIKFKTIQGSLNDGKKTKVTKRKNKKTKQKIVPISDNSALAPNTTPSEKPLIINKIKNGRIVKKKSENKIGKLSLTKKKDALHEFNMLETINCSSLQNKLKNELMGGRFRYINEQLYSMNSNKANKLFKEDKEAFMAYHEGYRHQVNKWPINPLDRIIKIIKGLPKSLEIGDFGCGDGRLAKEVPHKVYSMDLVSIRDDIIACDMANTPLQSGTLDIAVYCLSLMGTNLKEYLLEANRVLKLHGFVYIAEIQSRFENVRGFVRGLEACGFELVKKDVGANFFYFFQFRKVRNIGKVAKIPDFKLNPCLYRKRQLLSSQQESFSWDTFMNTW